MLLLLLLLLPLLLSTTAAAFATEMNKNTNGDIFDAVGNKLPNRASHQFLGVKHIFSTFGTSTDVASENIE